MVYCDFSNYKAQCKYKAGHYYDLDEIQANNDWYIDEEDDHLVTYNQMVDPVCFVDVGIIIARFEIMTLEA